MTYLFRYLWNGLCVSFSWNGFLLCTGFPFCFCHRTSLSCQRKRFLFLSGESLWLNRFLWEKSYFKGRYVELVERDEYLQGSCCCVILFGSMCNLGSLCSKIKHFCMFQALEKRLTVKRRSVDELPFWFESQFFVRWMCQIVPTSLGFECLCLIPLIPD